MKRIAVIVFFCSCLINAEGQVGALEKSTTRSSSGQFIVYPPRRISQLPTGLVNATNLVRLEPTFLAVSCERIKQALLRELDATGAWRGKVYFVLHAARSGNDPTAVNSGLFADGWAYQVELPDAIEATRLVGAIVQALLLEMANRNASTHSAELPIWLVEGLSQELLAASELDLVLQPPQTTINNVTISQKIRTDRKKNPLAAAHDRLRFRSPLTLGQLSWPTEEQLSGQAGEVYRDSAQLFVHELLQLKNGRACLRSMVEQLPQNLNWQTTFLRAFRAHFTRQLDLEKWWALQLVHFTGRDLTQTWPNEESWNKLDQIVRSPVQVWTNSKELPLRNEVSFQTIIREWDFMRQNRTLQDKLNQLQMLRLRMSPDLVFLVDGYRQTLETYLQKAGKAGLILNSRKENRPNVRRFVQETLNQLDALDAQRAGLRPNKNPLTAATTNSVAASRLDAR